MSEENGRPTAGQSADALTAEAKVQAIAAKALAVAETWIRTGVMDDALSEPLNETDPDRAAHMIANEAILDALGVEDLPFDLSPKITPLLEKRMADLNAGHVRFENIAEKVMQRVRDGAGLGSDPDEHDAAIKALVAGVTEHTLTGADLALVEAMVANKLADTVAAS